jgi:hypothetical protein
VTTPNQGFPMPPVSQQPKPKKKWPWIVGGLTAVIVVAAIAGGSNSDKSASTNPASQISPTSATTKLPELPPTSAALPTVEQPAIKQPEPPPVEPVKPETKHVVYTVAGAKSGSITYNVDGMTSIEQETDAKLPWKKEFDWPTDEALQIAQVSVQNSGSGQITCTITVDGVVKKTATSTGSYAIASCDASIGTLS